MKDKVIKGLIQRLRYELGEHSTDVDSILSQIEDNYNKGIPSSRFEFFHPTDGNNNNEVICEALFLNRDKNASIKNAAEEIYNKSCTAASLFNALMFITVAEEVKDSPYTVTVNISPQSACSKTFWHLAEPVLRDQGHKKFVFEIIEYGEGMAPSKGDLRVLRKAKNKGCRFALDDVCGFNDPRLDTFGPYVELLKIDGPVYKEMRDRHAIGTELHALCQNLLDQFEKNSKNARIKSSPPTILAEFVSSEGEFVELNIAGIKFAQGYELPSPSL